MRGHDAIIAMRKKGMRPPMVFINDYACITSEWPEYHEHATVEILPSESIEPLDFRFITGLMVSINGSTLTRTKAIAGACKRAGAKTVAAGCPAKDWAYIWHQPITETVGT